MSIPEFAMKDYKDCNAQLDNVKTIGLYVNGISTDLLHPNRVDEVTIVPYGPYHLWMKEMELAGQENFRLVPERFSLNFYEKEGASKKVTEAILCIRKIENTPMYKVCRLLDYGCMESVCRGERCIYIDGIHKWYNMQLRIVLADLGIW